MPGQQHTPERRYPSAGANHHQILVFHRLGDYKIAIGAFKPDRISDSSIRERDNESLTHFRAIQYIAQSVRLFRAN